MKSSKAGSFGAGRRTTLVARMIGGGHIKVCPLTLGHRSFVELTLCTAAALAGVIPADPNQAYNMNPCGGAHSFNTDAQAPLKEL